VDITALLLACSVHPDEALLSAIAHVHGRGNPYAVIDVSGVMVDQDEHGLATASSPKAARAAVERIIGKGGEPVLGLLPVRPEWAIDFGKTLDPCTDIAVGSAKLSELDSACRTRGREQAAERRSCTLDLYGRSLGLPALQRAVLADLSVPSPFQHDGSDVGSLPSPLAPTASSELFFTIPSAPAPAWSNDVPALWLEERP
jgi:hypothetical protein